MIRHFRLTVARASRARTKKVCLPCMIFSIKDSHILDWNDEGSKGPSASPPRAPPLPTTTKKPISVVYNEFIIMHGILIGILIGLCRHGEPSGSPRESSCSWAGGGRCRPCLLWTLSVGGARNQPKGKEKKRNEMKDMCRNEVAFHGSSYDCVQGPTYSIPSGI